MSGRSAPTPKGLLWGQKPSHAAQQIARSFDHLVGECEQFVGYADAEGFGSLEVDHQIETGRLFDAANRTSTMTEAIAGNLTESDILAAGQTLASAFQNDPLQVHVFPDAEERAERSPAQFSALVREGYLFGKVFRIAGMKGISVWMPPGRVTTAEQATASGFRELPRAMGNEAFTRFAMVLDYLSDVHGKATPAEHWYLIAVGVHPSQQRCGQGYALLKPIMARASAEGVPICLETAQPKVRAFYEKLGFKSVIESVHPDNGLRFWTYQRDP